MKIFCGTLFIFSILIAINSCDKVKSYSSVPQIGFVSYKLTETVDALQNKVKSLVVNFNFVDGDGDLFDPDSTDVTSPKGKLFLIFYQKKSGVFVQVPDSLLLTPPSFKLPYGDVMQREGQDKTQKGTIQFSYPFYYPMPYDTIKVKFYVADMAENHSDTLLIPDEIALK